MTPMKLQAMVSHSANQQGVQPLVSWSGSLLAASHPLSFSARWYGFKSAAPAPSRNVMVPLGDFKGNLFTSWVRYWEVAAVLCYDNIPNHHHHELQAWIPTPAPQFQCKPKTNRGASCYNSIKKILKCSGRSNGLVWPIPNLKVKWAGENS